MYRERVATTPIKSESAQRLQQALLNFHDLQQSLNASALKDKRLALSAWQSARLRQTHDDLHNTEHYRSGLTFLLTDLYAPQDFSARDSSLERIFPKMVKWLPESILDTVAELVELNHLTQKLDQRLTEEIHTLAGAAGIEPDTYCEAYRRCNNKTERAQQIQQVRQAGLLLDKYARSSVLRFTLKMAESPAEMAGLGQLHQFLYRGFNAFHAMQDVETLMQTLAQREMAIMHRIFDGHASPFSPEDAHTQSDLPHGSPLHA